MPVIVIIQYVVANRVLPDRGYALRILRLPIYSIAVHPMRLLLIMKFH